MTKSKHFLKDLVITKVDFVDAGCNQRANIMITKRDNSKGGENVNIPNENINVLTDAIAKALGSVLGQTDVAKAGFNEVMAEKARCQKLYKIDDEMWTLKSALGDSLHSILFDDEQTEKSAFMKQSVDEFSATMKACIDKWAIGESAGVIKSADGTITIESQESQTDVPQNDEVTDDVTKKEDVQMENTNALTVEEQAMFDLLMKKANIAKAEETPVVEAEPQEQEEVQEEVQENEPVETVAETATVETPAEVEKSVDDVIKGLNPAIADILKSLDEQNAKAEDAKLADVAKKYEILGIKTEDMVGVLKSVKGTAQYDAVMKRFDDMVAKVENSGLFTEIGKSGSGSAGDAWSRIEKHADDIMKNDPKITREKAIDKACEMHPELVSEYENGR